VKVCPAGIDRAEGKVRWWHGTYANRLAEPFLGEMLIVGGKVWESGRKETYFISKGGLFRRLHSWYINAYMKLFPRLYKRRWERRMRRLGYR